MCQHAVAVFPYCCCCCFCRCSCYSSNCIKTDGWSSCRGLLNAGNSSRRSSVTDDIRILTTRFLISIIILMSQPFLSLPSSFKGLSMRCDWLIRSFILAYVMKSLERNPCLLFARECCNMSRRLLWLNRIHQELHTTIVPRRSSWTWAMASIGRQRSVDFARSLSTLALAWTLKTKLNCKEQIRLCILLVVQFTVLIKY